MTIYISYSNIEP